MTAKLLIVADPDKARELQSLERDGAVYVDSYTAPPRGYRFKLIVCLPWAHPNVAKWREEYAPQLLDVGGTIMDVAPRKEP